VNHYLHLADLISHNHSVSITSVIHQCAEESAYRRKDNCYDIIMYSYQIITEFLTQWLISKVLYRQSLYINLLSFLVINLYQYKTLTSELHQIAIVM